MSTQNITEMPGGLGWLMQLNPMYYKGRKKWDNFSNNAYKF